MQYLLQKQAIRFHNIWGKIMWCLHRKSCAHRQVGMYLPEYSSNLRMFISFNTVFIEWYLCLSAVFEWKVEFIKFDDVGWTFFVRYDRKRPTEYRNKSRKWRQRPNSEFETLPKNTRRGGHHFSLKYSKLNVRYFIHNWKTMRTFPQKLALNF